MKNKHFLVTIKKAIMSESAREGVPIDIASMIATVPSATVLSGNRAVSVHVRVDSRHAADVVRVVEDVCTVAPYREMPLLTQPTVRSNGSFPKVRRV